jgi:hypothetical protein
MLAFRADHRSVKRLIEVGLRNADVVLKPPWHRSPERMNHAEDGITVHLGIGDNANCGQIVNLFEGNALPFHLLIDAVEVLGSPEY